MRGLLLSDFNIENFAGYLRNAAAEEPMTIRVAPFGQVQSLLADERASEWEPGLHFAVVWTRPEGVIPAFRDALAFNKFDTSEVDRQVDVFAAAINLASTRARYFFTMDWVLSPFHQGHGTFDLSKSGLARLLLRMNQRLLEGLDQSPNVIPLFSTKWFQIVGESAHNPRLWYSAKVPYSNDVFREATRDLRAAIHGLSGRSRKLIVLDLDDTLWGGIVGDVGWQNLKLGGHDPIGEAFRDFQHELKALTRRGVVLGIISKNEEAVAVGAIEDHPDMVLRRSDFAGWRINWGDKAENLEALMNELNLTADSAVFIDDNPLERARIKEAHPEVLVPEWPSDPRLYIHALLRLDCFDFPSISLEDISRVEMYATERKRTELKHAAASLEEWLSGLKISLSVDELNSGNIDRANQLLNKTNQFNLSTRRLTINELQGWASESGRKFWTFRVADRFGDSGLTGLLSIEMDGPAVVIQDFVLSCRVFGRHVEDAMLYLVTEWARKQGFKELVAVYKPTPKNKPTLDFLLRADLRRVDGSTFVWSVEKSLPWPAWISLSGSSTQRSFSLEPISNGGPRP